MPGQIILQLSIIKCTTELAPKDSPAKDARTIVEFKKRYKHLLVQGHYFKGLLAGSAYLYRKLFHK
ncbi:glycosyltransferase family 8 C-terminal domain-containing protein [Salmonella enterica]|uniref:glycosyltransferase family 8 C-terminal domain-containing protein n=1 Tax=Salmonella enterica TaxID=28901 RepID=UPI001F062141|nr:glycosyltransferase family 8 C-terminal domain-containing protein [Salmonella enterica]